MRFMVESPAQSGRMRTLIHRGPIPRGHVNPTSSSAARMAGPEGSGMAVQWGDP
jgi:hypothetical protein